MRQYLDLLRHVLEHGARKTDRTGTGTLAVFGYQMRFDLAPAFRWSPPRSCTSSRSSTSCCGSCAARPTSRYLREHGVTIWDEWADASGELGPVYGEQWRSWRGADGRTHRPDRRGRATCCKRDPHSRRIIVSAWNVGELDQMALPPCHALFQFYVADGRLSCQLYQRSADIFLGVPFNIASYALLTHMMAQQCGLGAGEFVWTGGDCHLYLNHLEQARLQLSREPLPLPHARDQAPARLDFRVPLRGFRDRRLPVTPRHQGADRRMKKAKQKTRAAAHHHAHMRHARAHRRAARTWCAARRSMATACTPRARIPKGTRIIEYLGERISHAAGRRALRGQGPGRRPHVPVHRRAARP